MTVYLWGNTDIQKAHFIEKKILVMFNKKKRIQTAPSVFWLSEI